MKLSIRLQAIANFVKKNGTVADIGTDHAYIPIYLVKRDIIKKAFALDINKGPLKKASENINSFGFGEKIITRLSNGLDKLKPEEADTIIIAGMGGELIIDIMERGREFFTPDKTFILSPHTKIDLVREFLLNNGFCISKEDMCIDEGKYYTVMEVKYSMDNIKYTENELLFGRNLINCKHPILLQFLDKEIKKYSRIAENNGLNITRKEEILYRLAMMKEVVNEMR